MIDRAAGGRSVTCADLSGHRRTLALGPPGPDKAALGSARDALPFTMTMFTLATRRAAAAPLANAAQMGVRTKYTLCLLYTSDAADE